MFGTRWQLFRIRGISVGIDASWLLILLLMTASFANFFHHEVAELSDLATWGLGLVTSLLFFLCIVLHELGHALTAQRLGIPMRGITLFLFGGVAEMSGEPKAPAHEFLMAIAGPIVSAVLALAFWGLANGGDRAGWSDPAVLLFLQLAWINGAVLLFNLVPAFPLDGGRVFRSMLWGITGNLRKATYWASLVGRGFAWFLIIVAVFRFFSPQPLSGLWLGLIGWFLHQAAVGSYQQVLIREALQGEPVRRFMNPTPIVVSPDLKLAQWVYDYVFRYHHKMYPVTSDGHIEGVINTAVLSRVPREEWEGHTIAELMRRDLRDMTVTPETDAVRALEKIQRSGVSRLLVVEGDRLAGIVSLKDLLRFLQLKLDLESGRAEGTEEAWTPVPQRADQRQNTVRP
jgi:Zn-dependent protease/CBS domain-containing protein